MFHTEELDKTKLPINTNGKFPLPETVTVFDELLINKLCAKRVSELPN
jgi:hypothetical protein